MQTKQNRWRDLALIGGIFVIAVTVTSLFRQEIVPLTSLT